jgi:hypothetical protein
VETIVEKMERRRRSYITRKRLHEKYEIKNGQWKKCETLEINNELRKRDKRNGCISIKSDMGKANNIRNTQESVIQ